MVQFIFHSGAGCPQFDFSGAPASMCFEIPDPAAGDFRLAFSQLAGKISSFMQAQEEITATDYLFRLWPWFEANAKRIAFGAAFLIIAVFIFSFYSYRQDQHEIAGSEALTQATISENGGQLADACMKIAADYAGTPAGQRALLEGATALFTTGKYADAQTAFQKFLDAYPDNFLGPQATLGVAASLDALGKTDLAVSAYQKAAAQTADLNVVANAKFSLARINEAQGKFAEAQKLYGEVARTSERTSLGSEAGLRAMELNAKLPKTPAKPAAAPAPAASAPFNLSK
jgi:TolA-binding protein